MCDSIVCVCARLAMLAIRHKVEAESYKQIALSLGVETLADVLFVTDVLAEARAAQAAGGGVQAQQEPL